MHRQELQVQLNLLGFGLTTDDFYNGMRITIYSGTGYGNTGVIATMLISTKTSSVQKENGTAGFDVFVNSGLSMQQLFDTTTAYEIEPRVALTGGGSQVEMHLQEQL